MKRSMLRANFVYKGKSTDYYTYSNVYHLSVRLTLFGRVKIEVNHGYYEQPFTGSEVKYKNIDEFNKNWQLALTQIRTKL